MAHKEHGETPAMERKEHSKHFLKAAAKGKKSTLHHKSHKGGKHGTQAR